jgi:signal transduction histidine kinase
VISRGHRHRLNRALHELRRPLQALALMEDRPGDVAVGSARDGLIELARSALAELDAAVNGAAAPSAPREVCCRELVLAAIERWRGAASEAGGIRVFWDAGPATVRCDPIRVSQALDNLMANAVEHGAPPVVVTGASVAGRVRITVANALDEASGGTVAADPRRGHGIEVVSEVARSHSGRFALCRTGSGCVAALEFPLTDGDLALAA